jgi:deoxyadenosine/deoxycytidine kinase
MSPVTRPTGPNPFDRYRHIVVEGPIGAGKTTLCRRLSDLYGAQTVLEEPQSNPFLERFYKDSTRYALPTQLFFLFQRVNQLRDLAQQDLFTRAVIGDFLIEKDPLFARLRCRTMSCRSTSRSSQACVRRRPRPTW